MCVKETSSENIKAFLEADAIFFRSVCTMLMVLLILNQRFKLVTQRCPLDVLSHNKLNYIKTRHQLKLLTGGKHQQHCGDHDMEF